MLDIAIVGAGPYGLSIATHLHERGISFRIFGRLMDSWLRHMPKGMKLKSDGFASNLYDPEGQFTLREYCAQNGIEYGDTGIPVCLDTFTGYGTAFQKKMVPELEEKLVTFVEKLPNGFRLELSDGETLLARRVILAVGITHFEYVPDNLAKLPSAFVSHSFRHRDLEPFRGRRVAVIGAGSSATDLAGLLHERGAEVQLITRSHELKFHGRPNGKPRSLWRRISHPQTGLGPGWKSLFFAEAPRAFHLLPEALRLEAVRRILGPSGGWFAKDMVVDRVPLLLGHTVNDASVQRSGVNLRLTAPDGSKRQVEIDHVIAATGYRVDVDRLTFLDQDLRSSIKRVNSTPILSSNFESSVPGLYFTGIAAANSFGPVMRFAFGAGFAARHLSRTVIKSASRGRAAVPLAEAATTAR